MNITQTMQAQGGRPSGVFGTIIGYLMNMAHGNVQAWGLRDIRLADDAVCLDVGCGGGKAVKVLAKTIKHGRVHGLDHSTEMVALAKRVNRAAITHGIVDIQQGSVSALPYGEAYFDLVSAFETIQFWPDIPAALSEIRRVLKLSSTFLIVNRYPPEHSKWADFLQLKNVRAYEARLRDAGFGEMVLDTTTKPGWIKIVARGCG